VAFDVYATENVQLIADGHQIPFANGTFDAVIVQAVLEHVVDPWTVVQEIHRVLRMGGVVYAETPFLQQVHEGAYDFTRFTESGHRYLFKDFDLIRSGASAGPGTQTVWTVEHLARSVFRSRMTGKMAKAAFFWVRYLDMIIPTPYQIDSASGVFFMGRKNGRTISVEEIVQHYSGADR
jgi:ubiquinone/menaquinone biosynthesis C-methylase UbiE